MSESVMVMPLRLTAWCDGGKGSGSLTPLGNHSIGNDRGDDVRELFDQRHSREGFAKRQLHSTPGRAGSLFTDHDIGIRDPGA